MHTRIVRCERNTCTEPDGTERTLFFKLDVGRLGKFVHQPEMPPFEGRRGFVEILGPNTRIKVLRQVEEGTPSREASEAERKAIYSYRHYRRGR